MKRNIALLAVMEVLRCAQFLTSIWVVYLEAQKHMSLEMFLVMEGVFAAAMLLMEIPSGWLADKTKRTTILQIANALFVLSLLALLVADDLPSVILSQVLMGIGFSFASGTHQATLYESLTTLGRKKDYARVYGQILLTENTVLALATLAGSFLYAANPQLPVFAWLVAAVGAFICSLFLAEPKRPKPPHRAILQDMREVFTSTLTRSIRLKAYMLINMVTFGSMGLLYWMQQPYYQTLYIPTTYFGPLLFVDSLLFGLGGYLGGYALFKSPQAGIRVASVIITLGIAVLAFLPFHKAGIAIFWAIGMAWSYGDTILQERLQHLALPHMRATVLSMASFLKQGYFLCFSQLAALILNNNIQNVFLLALPLVIITLAYSFWCLFSLRAKREWVLDGVHLPK